ncbi:MAG: aminodeoxychorismate synthase component I [Mycobacteriales bacterium]
MPTPPSRSTVDAASGRVLLVDNYDSFSWNLVHAIGRAGAGRPLVLRNDDTAGLAALDLSTLDAILVSPGPGRPDRDRDVGLSRWAFEQDRLPVLGICLGHQLMCLAAGARVERAPEPVHGRLDLIHHGGQGLFAGIPSPFPAVRYHSLLVYDLPAAIEPLAHTGDGLLMAARHRDKPQWGVQFHPESIATEHGERLLAGFLDLAGVRRGSPAPPAPRPVPAGSPYQLVVRELPRAPDPEAAFAALFGTDPAAYWLDSAGTARFSVLGGSRGPLAELVSYRVDTGEVAVTHGGEVRRHRETLFDHLDRMLAERRLPDPGLPTGFGLGYVGYLGYELKADCGGTAAHRTTEPDAMLLFSDRALLVDHRDRRGWLLALSTREHPAERWLAETAAVLAGLTPLPEPARPGAGAVPPPVLPRHDRDGYAALIGACQEEIAAGESYEVCLTNELSVPVLADPWQTYRVLRRTNPAPYGAFLRLPGLAVLSSSPERFLRIGGDGRVESRPIKGTRPRGGAPRPDRALAAELLGSEKERAENLMIVDLVRNDLGRVAELGSVDVPELFAVETYRTVHQLVSTVTARLAPSASTVDCVRAAFPGGSVTGAPKLRTMEILDRLEGGPRGVYTGALGYFSLTGGADLGIVIRTMVVTPREVRIGVGGAITALADAAAEIEETRVKARALLPALPAVELAEAAPR